MVYREMYAILALLVVAFEPPSGEPVPAQIHFLLESLVNVLDWERSLRARCSDGVRIAVLTSANSPTQGQGHDLVTALQSGGFQSQGLSLTALLFEVSPGQVSKRLEPEKACVLLLAPDLEATLLPEIGRVATSLKALVVTGTHGHLNVAGVAVLGEAGAPRIVVNLQAVEAQGAHFDARMLRFAEVRTDERPTVEKPEEAKARRITGRDPEYPSIARTAGVGGIVLVKVRIGPGGDVEEVTFLRSSELFKDEVAAAIKTWRFRPRMVDGRPTSTSTVFKFEFRKSGSK